MSNGKGNLIDEERMEIGETGVKAIARLSLALSDTDFLCPEDWILMLGQVFALYVENMDFVGKKIKRKKKALFKNMIRGDFDVNQKIEEYLLGLSRNEKIALIAFLIGIAHPMSYKAVEGYASLKLPPGF